MNSRDTSTLRPKILAAVAAVAIALTGILTGLEWLSVAALVLWVVAMIVFGTGKRNQTE